MSITGDWENSYGSIMSLKQGAYGIVIGVYTSSTGSSGEYWVLGYTDPSPANGVGQSLALSIFWRSFQRGGKPDPSWHYVSGLCGQCITLNNVPTLSLIHDMVATTPFPGVVPVTGNFMDKLIYTPSAGGGQARAEWAPKISAAADPVNGGWVCVQNPLIRLALTLQEQYSGYLTGALLTPNGQTVVAGFADTYASADGLPVEGVALGGLLPDGHSVVSLAGSLNLQQNVLTLAWFQGVGTTPAMTWIETNMQSLTFTRA